LSNEKTNIQLNEVYLPLWNSDKRYFVVTGGRGSGKSYGVTSFLDTLSYEIGHRTLFTRYTMTAAEISIIPEFTEKIPLIGKLNHFKITENSITNTISGSDILFRGIKTSSGNQTANLKSLQGITTWVLDEAEELTDQDTFDKIDLSIRAKNKQNRVILVLNPTFKKHWIYKEFIATKRDDVEYIHTTYLDNIENLSQSFIDKAEKVKKQNYAKYLHQFMGEWIDEVEGALWNDAIIDKCRVTKLPDMKRIVVAIDPAVTAHKNSDETGIIVCGVDIDGIGYVLEDLSGTYTPAEWAKVAINAYHKYNADKVIAEVNNGGDLVEANLRTHDRNVSYKAIRATKGKYTRAEPVAALYEDGKVRHNGNLYKLEEQLTTWNAKLDDSPDRLDALVWGLTELMITKNEHVLFYA
jgi:PBSX family phage terminase large subunit